MKVIELTQGQVAIVDDEDFAELAQYRWHFHDGHASRNAPDGKGGQKTLKMHRVIMGISDPKICVGHKSRNDLDNRRSNLRIATRIQTGQNRNLGSNNKVGLKGVFFRKECSLRPYRAFICVNGKNMPLGYFDTAEKAHAAYCAAAVVHFGEFARMN